MLPKREILAALVSLQRTLSLTQMAAGLCVRRACQLRVANALQSSSLPSPHISGKA